MSAMKELLETKLERAAQGYARQARAEGFTDITASTAFDVIYDFAMAHLDAFTVYLKNVWPVGGLDSAYSFGADLFSARQGNGIAFYVHLLGYPSIELQEAADALGKVAA